MIFLFPCFAISADVPYVVQFSGVQDSDAQKALQSISQLENLKEYPPLTVTSLKRRAEKDLPNLVKGMQTRAYYHPEIDFQIDTESSPAVVEIMIDPGPIYPLVDFQVIPFEEEEEPPFPIEIEQLRSLGVKLNVPAYPSDILEDEILILNHFACLGYPLAKVKKREVIANEADRTVSVKLYIERGPLTYFGYTYIKGLNKVKPEFIVRKIKWNRKEVFNPTILECTQQAIEDTGLFSSVVISNSDDPTEDEELDLTIELNETRHRSIGFGVSYATDLGPGGTFEWEHRNVRGIGERLRFLSDVWWLRQRGVMSYRQPDFKCQGQDLYWIAEGEREKTDAYKEKFLSLSTIMDRQLNERTKISYGVQFKQLHSKESQNNGSFSLLKLPTQYRWSNANSLLQPTHGKTFNLKFTPTFSLVNDPFTYYITQLNSMFYVPVTKDERLIWALKVSFGSIFGAADAEIPSPEKLYAGSDNLMRGYKYQTLSPLDPTDPKKPIGGRSLMAYSFEVRKRIGESFGLVGFYEVGNVFASTLPKITKNFVRSIGFGFRYYTAVGPLRLDFAFPLDPREGIDHTLEFYIGIGEAF